MSPHGPREPTENEKEHAYVMHNKREKGEKLQGDAGAFLDDMGEHGEVKQRREASAAIDTQLDKEARLGKEGSAANLDPDDVQQDQA